MWWPTLVARSCRKAEMSIGAVTIRSNQKLPTPDDEKESFPLFASA